MIDLMKALQHFSIAILIAIALHFSVGADDEPKHPMPPEIRAKFDRVMSDLWHEDCECWRFIYKGKIHHAKPQLSDDDAWSILDLIERGDLLPLPRTGSTS